MAGRLGNERRRPRSEFGNVMSTNCMRLDKITNDQETENSAITEVKTALRSMV